jgi:hypothetical protein
MRKPFMAFPPGIIFYFFAVRIQFDLLPSAILEAMQVDLDAGLMKAADLMKGINHSPVICRVRDVHAYYVQMLIHEIC